MPRLSVTIIARNEERNLPRVLASVNGVADEIVVVDTGSTDQTVQIARESGARVEHFAWIDDFSAAHNYCNRLATGDWLLMLDADEELLAESKPELAACLADPRALAYGVLRQDLVDEARPELYTEMWQLRLFRNLPDLRFVGRFHHHFEPPIEETAARLGMEVHESAIRIRHYGFLARLRDEKRLRAARLLELELADRPDQFYYLVELGLTRLALGDTRGHENLARAAGMVAQQLPQALNAGAPLALLLEHVLAQPQLAEGFPLSRAAALQLARARFPTAPPLLMRLANEQYARSRFAECAQLLEQVLALMACHGYDRLVSFDPAQLVDDARLNLGACRTRMGQLAKAEHCFRMLLDSPTRGKAAADNLKALSRLRRK